MAKDDPALKRLGGGRWQSRDERFTIEPQSGTWVIVDAEQTDDLGLPLVRGPFATLTAAKAAIADARDAAPAASPLAEKAEQLRRERPESGRPRDESRTRGGPTTTTKARSAASPRKERAEPKEAATRESPAEPSWLADLGDDERRRARRLMAALRTADAPDPEGIARRDVAGRVPAAATYALERAIRELGVDPSTADLIDLLADGSDRSLGVRWRLVDGEGRPISLDPDRLR